MRVNFSQKKTIAEKNNNQRKKQTREGDLLTKGTRREGSKTENEAIFSDAKEKEKNIALLYIIW